MPSITDPMICPGATGRGRIGGRAGMVGNEDSSGFTGSFGTDALGAGAISTDTLGTDAFGADAIGADAFGPDTPGTDALGTDALGADTVGAADFADSAAGEAVVAGGPSLVGGALVAGTGSGGAETAGAGGAGPGRLLVDGISPTGTELGASTVTDRPGGDVGAIGGGAMVTATQTATGIATAATSGRPGQRRSTRSTTVTTGTSTTIRSPRISLRARVRWDSTERAVRPKSSATSSRLMPLPTAQQISWVVLGSPFREATSQWA